MKRRQRGITLVEISLGLIVTMLIAAEAVKWKAHDNWISRLTTVADQANEVAGALTTYNTNNYAQLASATPVVAGYANPMAPTITEIKTPPTGPLNQGFTATNGLGGNWVLNVTKVPAGCVAPACDLLGTVALSSPVYIPGTTTVDEDGLGAMLQHLGGSACYSTPADPTHCTAANGVTIPNPLGNVAGIFVIKTNFGSSGLSRFYARDASTGALTASLQMGGNSISGLMVVAVNSVCSTPGDIASGPKGEYLNCYGGQWKANAGLNWKGYVASFASLPSSGQAGGDAYRVTAAGNHIFVWDAQYNVWEGLDTDAAGNLTLAGVIYTAGSASNYGAITMQGSKNGWAGINFKDAGGNNAGTLMMTPSYSGFFNAADNNWRLLVDNAGNTQLGDGSVPSYSGDLRGTLTPGWAVETWGCSPNGAQARAAYDTINGWAYSGIPLHCESGTWRQTHASTGTGMTGILAPLAGKVISCGYNGNAFYAYVDGAGNPYARVISTFGGDTGWRAGYTASGVTNGPIAIYANWNIPTLTATDANGQLLCTAGWPAT